MAAGIPVIAAMGGAAEVATAEVDALLHPPEGCQRPARALRRMADDTELRRRLAGAGRERAGQFGPDVIGSSLMQLYAQILGPRR